MYIKQASRTYLSLLLSFFLAICTVGLCIYVEGKTSVVGKRYFRESVIKSNYISEIQKEVKQEVSRIVSEKEVDSQCVEQLLDEERIYMDLFNYIDSIYGGKEENLQATAFKEELSAAVKDYFKEQNVSDSMVNEIVTDAAGYYETFVTPDFVPAFYAFSNSLNQKLTILGAISGVLFFMILILLLKMHHIKGHAVPFIIYSGITAVILNGMIAIAIGKGGFIKQLNIGPSSYLSVLNEMVNKLQKHCYITTVAVAGLVLIIIVSKAVLDNVRIHK